MHSATESDAGYSERLFLEELESRINPEKSREFDPEQFREKLRVIESLLTAGRWPSPAGRVISVVGSNGKGSITHLLSWIFEKLNEGDGPTAGIHTSPHLLTPLERVRLDRKAVDGAHSLEALTLLKDITGELYPQLSYFETISLASILLFRQLKIPFEIHEAGIGGRLDATRLSQPDTVVLTTISLEHTRLLGEDHLSILKEKLAISGEKTELVFAPTLPWISRRELEEEIQIAAPGSTIAIYNPERSLESYESYLEYNREYALYIVETMSHHSYRFSDPSTERVLSNATPESIQKIRSTKLPMIPGRREVNTTQSGVRVIFDTAHTPDAVTTLLRGIGNSPDRGDPAETLIVLAVLAERNPADLIKRALLEGYRDFFIIKASHLAPLREEALELLREQMNREAPCSMNSAIPFSAISIDVLRFQELLAEKMKKSGVKSVLMFGSHRIYYLYKMVVEGYQV